MAIKYCKHCGKEFKPNDYRQVFCSMQCSARNRWGVEDADTGTCPYNDAVECSSRKCSKCGWNPEVAKARLEAHERKGTE